MPDYMVQFFDEYQLRVTADNAADAENEGMRRTGDPVEKVTPCPPDKPEPQEEPEPCPS